MQRRKALRDKEVEAVVDLAGSVFGWSGSRRVGYVNPMALICRGFQLGCVGSTVVAWSWNVCISVGYLLIIKSIFTLPPKFLPIITS